MNQYLPEAIVWEVPRKHSAARGPREEATLVIGVPVGPPSSEDTG